MVEEGGRKEGGSACPSGLMQCTPRYIHLFFFFQQATAKRHPQTRHNTPPPIAAT